MYRTRESRRECRQAKIDDDQYLFTCEDPAAEQLKKEKINAQTPGPAHVLG